MWHDGPDGWGWLWMALMMALFWVPFLLLAFWAIREWSPGARRAPEGPDDASDAVEIARRAYARGELSRERFFEITADLERGSPPDEDRHAET